ncbi:Lectin subunit alpha [Orchesella cincta]|uniref:Lectin subunit alpha n=1 Tax=Orchesella cincta TaxID=48709 RepID=A0A1D2N2C9_ORCCI|nr:Lectin subunit alpha [Orchesella cincta]
MDKPVVIFVVAVACFLAGSVIGQFESVNHGGYTFSVSETALPWAQAKESCESIGQKLVSIENATKDDVMVQLFVEKLHTNVTLRGNSWISAAEVTEGVWHYASINKPTYHTRWFVGQPDDTENLNCVYLAVNAMLYWRDANCSASMYYICEP